MMQYVDFLVTLQPFCEDKEIRQAQAQINDTQTYDVCAAVLASSDEFNIAVMEEGWIAFIFDNHVYIYRCSCVDQLLTDRHLQSISN